MNGKRVMSTWKKVWCYIRPLKTIDGGYQDENGNKLDCGSVGGGDPE